MALRPIWLGLLLIVLAIARRRGPRIHDRCLKMALLAVFLAYPFVSQTSFQAFSCTTLDAGERWLDVDFQVGLISEGCLRASDSESAREHCFFLVL